ncbi:MAG: hypothetical protein AB1345_10695 [Chloroflexota bacterium]
MKIQPDSENDRQGPAHFARGAWWRWALGGFFALLIIATSGAFIGYQVGMRDRTQLAASQLTDILQQQFSLGLQDIDAGRYELARQRFEFIVEQDPNFPGVLDKLAEVISMLSITATATTEPTPTEEPPTPTPDLRGAEELYQEVQQMLAAGDWTQALQTLDTLRKNYPTYQAVKVDGMYYIAFRNRGVDRILREGNLEGGTYDLGQVQRFGPLDAEASGYRDWARFYITGASFWEIDWGQAAYYFGLVAPVAPNIHDGTGWTAMARYREAVLKYAEFLAEAKMWCEARDQLEALLALGSDPEIRPTATYLEVKCEPPTPVPPEPTEVTPTETPTPEVTPTP